MKTIIRKITRYFFEGLLVLGPLAVTLYVVYLIFHKIDDLYPYDIPGLGFITTIAIVVLVGFMASNFLTRAFVRQVDIMFTKMPFVKLLYNAVKDIMDAFVGDKKSFDKPVVITLVPGSNVRMLGFVTLESLSMLGEVESVSVYVPMAFNMGGNFLIVPKTQVRFLDIPSGEVMAMIVSGGVAAVKEDKPKHPDDGSDLKPL